MLKMKIDLLDTLHFNELRPLLSDYKDFYLLDPMIRNKEIDNVVERLKCMKNFCFVAIENRKLAGLIEFNKSAFETGIFGFDCAAINLIHTKGSEVIAGILIDKFLEWCDDEKIKFSSVKCSIDSLDIISALELRGFKLIEAVLTFRYDFSKLPPKNGNVKNNNIRLANYRDKEKIRKLSGDSFVLDRFHMDSRFNHRKASELKAQWAENCCTGRSDAVFVADVEGEVGGFVACNIKGDTGWIDLIATSPKFRKRKIGLELLYTAEDWFSSRCKILYASTQACNVASSNMYLKAGFDLTIGKMTFHRWHKEV